MAAKKFKVVVEITGSEQERQAAYNNTLKLIINKYMCEVRKDEGSNIFEGINGGTSRERLLNTSTERRVYQ